MKRRLPSNWIAQLIAIILLFSLGVSFIPTGYLVEDLMDRSTRPPYSYYGSFTANLTVTNPIEIVELGYCSDILIQEWTLTPTTPILLQIRSYDNSTRYILPLLNETNQEIFARFTISLPHSNYTLNAIRQTNNTYFQCWISAYPFYYSARSSTYLYLFWSIGLIMIIVATALTYLFYTRTKNII